MGHKVRQLDGYIRVSRRGGRKDENFVSPDLQRQKIEGWAMAHGVEITWHKDEIDQSGGSMNRPVFAKILQRIRAGESEGMIVAKLDRFARTMIGGLTTLEEFDRYGAVLVCVDDNIDLSTPMGKAFMRILMTFAELERDRIKASFNEAATNAIRLGKKVGGVKFGYDRVDQKLVPNKYAPVVRRAFEIAAERNQTGLDMAPVRSYLEKAAPDFYWDTQHAADLIRCRTYLGEVWWGTEVNRKAHEPIVTAELFQAAQRTVRFHRKGQDYPLSGIATCETCGEYLVGHATYTRGYACRSKARKDGSCERPVTIRADVLETYCREQLLNLWAGGWKATRGTRDDLSAALQALEEAEEELRLFASDLTARRLLGNEYHAQLEARVKARDDAQAAFRGEFQGEDQVEMFDAAGLTENATTEELRSLMAAAFATISVKPVGRGFRVPPEERITLILHGADGSVAPTTKDVPDGEVEAAA